MRDREHIQPWHVRLIDPQVRRPGRAVRRRRSYWRPAACGLSTSRSNHSSTASRIAPARRDGMVADVFRFITDCMLGERAPMMDLAPSARDQASVDEEAYDFCAASAATSSGFSRRDPSCGIPMLVKKVTISASRRGQGRRQAPSNTHQGVPAERALVRGSAICGAAQGRG